MTRALRPGAGAGLPAICYELRMAFRDGDRVRIRKARSEYTGCRGTVVDGSAPLDPAVSALGHFVAIDGENGRLRPFLVHDLEPLRAAPVRRRQARQTPRSGLQ
ncbi:MAG: hypothetical protein NZ990_18705 [Myxococcota bacterium]|nr:hypothetical protein [Myxococcota bacterium]